MRIDEESLRRLIEVAEGEVAAARLALHDPEAAACILGSLPSKPHTTPPGSDPYTQEELVEAMAMLIRMGFVPH